MTAGLFLHAVIVILAAIVIAVRCICVVYNAHHSTHPGSYLHFLAFGFSYIALAAAAFVTAQLALNGVVPLVATVFVLASAGMILFDRRRRRDS